MISNAHPDEYLANEWPTIEMFEPQEWKVLFMLLCENRASLDLEAGLTDYGKRILNDAKRKIGILVVGVDIYASQASSDVGPSKEY